ncbi:AAA family ATPase [Bacillus gobiensis]|uniref:AAA family ATPase n=1 Tax=Bacillus gobiensis TaxID=1441095 RepID=UPI003D192023
MKGNYLKSIELVKEKVLSFDEFPFCLPIIKDMGKLEFRSQVTYIVGENGMGKSTFLEALAMNLGFNPEGGSFNFNFSTFDSHSKLGDYIRLAKGARRPKDGFFLRAETFYNLASNIEALDSEEAPGPRVIDSYGGVSLHEQSHGESFFSLFMHRFGGNGLYILDEPEAALSPLRQISMLSRIHELAGQNSQFIIATHSPIIMAYPDSQIFELTEEGVNETSLEETNHYRMMKQFFLDKDRLLHHLFEK